MKEYRNMVMAVAFLLSGIVLLFSLSSGVLAEANPAFEILDSNFPAEDSDPTAWLDNERVLFTGVDVKSAPCTITDPRCGGRGLLNAAYVWDVRLNRVSKYRDRRLIDLCVQGDYLSYKTNDHSQSVYAGSFGNEKKLSQLNSLQFNPVSCKYHSKPVIRTDSGRVIRFLLEHHGYVDFGAVDGRTRTSQDREDSRPKLHSPNGERSVPLNIQSRYRANLALSFKYVPHMDAYLARGDTGRADDITPAFILWPTGEIKRITIPDGVWTMSVYFGVRPGLFIVSDSWRGERASRAAGGYLLTEGKVSKVLAGSLRSVSVSPDGCRVAFIYASTPVSWSDGYRDWKEGKAGNTVRMLNVCGGAAK